MAWTSPAKRALVGLLLWGLLARPALADNRDPITIVENGQSDWHLSLRPGAGDTERLAAGELAAYIERMTAVRLSIVEEESPGPRAIAVSCRGGEGEAFSISANEDLVEISGEGPVGCLYGAYELLEHWGCRWFYPGTLGEVVPQRTSLELSRLKINQKPSFPSRSLIVSGKLYFAHFEDWIDWSAKRRINNLFTHGGEPAEIHLPELERRGITLEIGGHRMPGLLPRELFESHPEYFREVRGARTKQHNFCPTSAGGRKIVQAAASKYFRGHPGVAFYHLWADDLNGGGWCSCGGCAELTASDQALLATNFIAESLEEIWPQARLAYLAYHDTTKVPTSVRPRHNVFLLNAPRERCYAHGMGDPECSRNHREYRPQWELLDKLFEQDGQENSHAFEYYVDSILFRSMQPPLLEVIPADARYYRGQNLPVYQSLVVSTRDWRSPPFSLHLFAAAAWNADVNSNELLEDYCRHYFGPESEAMVVYFHALEEAFRSILAFDVYEGPIRDLRGPQTEPEAAAREKLRDVARARPLLTKARDLVRQAKERTPAGPYRERLGREEDVLEITELEVTALHAQFASSVWLRQYQSQSSEPLRRKVIAVAEEGLDAIDLARKWMNRFSVEEMGETSFYRIHDHQAKSLEGVLRLKEFHAVTLFGRQWLLSPGAKVEGQQVHTRSGENWRPEGLFTPARLDLPDSGLEISYWFQAERTGRDSQALFSTDGAALAHRFCFFAAGKGFVVYTAQDGQWAPRASGGKMVTGRPYKVTALVKPTSFSVTVEDEEQESVWASGDVPMDQVTRTGLGFLDAEPEADATATRWWEIRIQEN